MHLQALLDRCLCFNLRNCLELWIFSWGYVRVPARQIHDNAHAGRVAGARRLGSWTDIPGLPYHRAWPQYLVVMR